MKEILDQSSYESMAAEIALFVKENVEQGHPYAVSYPEQLSSIVSNYINFQNFKRIQRLLGDKKNLTILDLGCGVGDKSIITKKLFPSFKVLGLETTAYDDPEHTAHQPHLFFEKMYKKINAKYEVELGLFDGLHVNLPDNSLDVLMLYAVIEHIAPEHRQAFMDSVTPKLKSGGYLIITRCPRRLGVMELISRNLKLGAHEWTLRKSDLVNLLKKSYVKEEMAIMNNVPNNYRLTMKAPRLWIAIDKVLQFLHWPFATDYYLVAKKK